jgi:hypothetical protein
MYHPIAVTIILIIKVFYITIKRNKHELLSLISSHICFN